MGVAKMDENSRQTSTALASDGSGVVVPLYADKTTHRLLIDSSGGAITSINTDATAAQTLTVGTTGTDFAIVDNGSGDHKFNLPDASATARGVITTGAQTIAGEKTLNNILKFPQATGTKILLYPVTASTGYGFGVQSGILQIISDTSQRVGIGTGSTSSFNETLTVTGTVVGIGNSSPSALLTLGTAGTKAGAFSMAGGTSGTVTFAVPAAAGTNTLTFPAATDTLVGLATSDALSNKTYNGLTVTANGTNTLNIAAGKTLVASNSLTLAGTDSTTMTFPSTSASIARTDAAQTFTGTQTFSQVITTANAITASSNAATVPVTSRHNIVTNDSAATLTITLTTTSAVNMQTCVVQILDASAAAQTISWVNTENSTVAVPTTSNGSTTLPLTVGFIFNSATSKWRCVTFA